MERRKVLVFLAPGVGGAQRMSIRLAALLDSNKYDVCFYIVGNGDCIIRNFIPDSANSRLLQIKNVYDFLTIRIIRLLKKERPYAVFSSLMYLNIRVILAARLVGGIHIIVRHNSMIKNLKKAPITLKLAKSIYRLSDRVISQTKEMAEELHSEFNLPKEKILTMYNPIDEQQIQDKIMTPSPYPNLKGPKYAMVGRVDPVKGYEFAINAFAKVFEQTPNAHLYIVGEYSDNSNYYKNLQTTIQELGLSENIHFVGYTDNPYVWMYNADVFMLTSKVEGLPNALIEATYLQIPSIATQCAQVVNDIIIDGKNGYVVDYGKDSALSDRMLKALNLPHVKSPYQGATAQDVNRAFDFD